MKRLKLILCLFCVILFNISVITAENATCWKNGLFTNYTLRMYKKTCKIGGINYISFCTRFKADAPDDYTCQSVDWNNNSNENTAISYAVGYIIRNYNVSQFDGNYTLAESAINKFFYKLTGDYYTYDDYYMSISSQSTLNKYTDTQNNAFKIYENRRKGKDYNASGERKIQISARYLSNDKNQLNVTVNCYDEYGSKSCSSSSVVATIGNSSYTMKKESDDSGTAKFTLDISNILSTYEENKNVTINIKAMETLKYCKANNYKCGGYQSMTPNKCTSIDEIIETTDYITTTGTKKIEDNCQNLVNEAKNKYKATDQKKYYETLLSIYQANKEKTIENLEKKCSDCEVGKFGEILNLSNPSCSKISTDKPTLTCNGINTKFNFIHSDSSGHPYYCTSNFSLDTSKTIGPKYEFNYGDLLYRSDDGYVADGTLSYSCQIPSGSSISITPQLPKLQLNVKYKPTSAIFESYLNDSICSSKSCQPILLDSVSSTFNGAVKYKYSSEFEYKLAKGSQFRVVTSADCKNNACIKYGYGFPTNTNWENGESSLKIYKSSNIIGQDSSTTCKYNVHPNDNKWTADLMYRGINTQSPFLTYKGDARTTGSNWCETNDLNYSQSTIIDSDNSSQNSGIDITNIYKDANSGDYSAVYDLNNNGYLDGLDIRMLQAILAGNESIYFNSNFSLDKYWWYTGSTVISANDMQTHYQDFLYEVEDNSWYDIDTITNPKDKNIEIYTIDNTINKQIYDFNGDKDVDVKDVVHLKLIAKEIFVRYGTNYELHKGYNIYSALGIEDGDVNYDGFVNSDDYSMLEEVLNGNETLNVVQKYYADCDRNGYLNEDDKKCIQDIINPQNIQKSDLDENGVLKNPIEINQEKDLFARIDSDEFTNSCSNNNATVKTYITNRPTSAGTKNSVSTEKTEPLYSFMLTPNIIKKIRDYNKVNQYDDFNLGCSNGYNCISDFVSALYKGTYDDGKIKAANVSGNDKCSDRGKFCEVTG